MTFLSALAALTISTRGVLAQEINLKGNADYQVNARVEVSNKFVMQGEITAAGQNSFVILGEIVAIPEGLANDLNGQGIIKAGNTVEVEGIISNGIKIAQEVTLMHKSDIQVNKSYLDGLISAVKNIFTNL